MVGTLEPPIVTLTTDFGSNSPYVAQMKGILLSRNPRIQIIDISHEIAPQDIAGASIVLDDVCCRFPAGTIHVAVIDPGVGTERSLIFAKLGDHLFLTPDNGVLTRLATRLPNRLLVTLDNPLYFLPTVSRTFHGRDILAPVAAHLTLGLNPRRLGTPRKELTTISIAQPRVDGRHITGEIIQIDHFGNLITSIRRSDLKNAGTAELIAAIVGCKGKQIRGILGTYGEQARGSLIAIFGSSERLELAVVEGNAAATLSAEVGDEVSVETTE